MIFKVARKRRKPRKIYTRGSLHDSYRERVMPPRAVDAVRSRSRSRRRKTRYDLVPASRSLHRARSSLVITKLPLWKIRSALHSLYFLFHRRRYPPFLAIPSATLFPPFVSFFFLGVIAKSATHYPILPPPSITFRPSPQLFPSLLFFSALFSLLFSSILSSVHHHYPT